MMYRRLSLSLLLVSGCSLNSAHANENSWTDRVQLHGFLTQAYINTDHNNWFGDSEDGSFDFTELGLNAWVQLSPKFSASAQVLSRRAGETDDGSPHLDYGFVTYQHYQSAQGDFGFRVGRVKNKMGLYNDTRDVAATRPGIFMPQSIYFGRIRNLFLSSDGISTYGSLHSDIGSFYLNINIGEFQTDKNERLTFLGSLPPGSLPSDKNNVISNLLYEYDGGRIRLALTNVDYTVRYNASPNPFFTDGSVDGVYRILSAEYNTEFWSYTAEYSRQPLKYNKISALFDTFDGESESYYFQVTRRFLNSWSSWLRYEASYRDKDDKNGEGRAKITGLKPHTGFTKSWVIGTRWDISSNWLISAEYQKNDGTFILSRVENSGLKPREQKWNIFSLLVSYRF